MVVQLDKVGQLVPCFEPRMMKPGWVASWIGRLVLMNCEGKGLIQKGGQTSLSNRMPFRGTVIYVFAKIIEMSLISHLQSANHAHFSCGCLWTPVFTRRHLWLGGAGKGILLGIAMVITCKNHYELGCHPYHYGWMSILFITFHWNCTPKDWFPWVSQSCSVSSCSSAATGLLADLVIGDGWTQLNMQQIRMADAVKYEMLGVLDGYLSIYTDLLVKGRHG